MQGAQLAAPDWDATAAALPPGGRGTEEGNFGPCVSQTNL